MKNVLLYTGGVLVLLCFNLSFLMAQDDAFLGVQYNHVSNEKAKKLGFENSNGAYLTGIFKNSTADKMGLQPLDYIYQVNGQALSKSNSFHDAFESIQPGDLIQVSFLRNGEAIQKSMPIGTRANTKRVHRSADADPFLGVSQDYSYPSSDPEDGVLVNVVECSTAEEMGIQEGDVVQKIDGYPTYDWHDLGAAIDNREVGDEIEVTFRRNGERFTASLPIKSYEETKNGPCNNEIEKAEPVANAIDEEGEKTEIDMWMEDVTEAEAVEMKEKKGIDMPVVNDLQIERLNIFPNPSNGIFNLQFELPESGNTLIRLFSAQGRLIYQYELGVFSGPFQDRLDLSNNFKGIYFLEIRQNSNSITQKIIIQ